MVITDNTIILLKVTNSLVPGTGHKSAYVLHGPCILLSFDFNTKLVHSEWYTSLTRAYTPLENHKNIGFLSDTGPDPMKITKLSSQHSTLGHHRRASATPFK